MITLINQLVVCRKESKYLATYSGRALIDSSLIEQRLDRFTVHQHTPSMNPVLQHRFISGSGFGFESSPWGVGNSSSNSNFNSSLGGFQRFSVSLNNFQGT